MVSGRGSLHSHNGTSSLVAAPRPEEREMLSSAASVRSELIRSFGAENDFLSFSRHDNDLINPIIQVVSWPIALDSVPRSEFH